jgi:SAM-dependent methyltransferase
MDSEPLARLRQILSDRPVPPRPWDDDRCDWADPDFSANFARTGSLGPGRAKREAAFLADLVPADAGLVLDVACGAGRTARALVAQGYRVLGTDLGPGAVALAQEKAPAGAEFRLGDMTRDEYPEGPFSMAYCVDGGLAGLRREDAVLALGKLGAALRSGAPLVLECPSEAMAETLDMRQDWYVDHDSPAGAFPQLVLTEDFYDREALAYMHRGYCLDLGTGALHGFAQTYAIYSEESLAELLEGAGFELERCHGDFGPDAFAPEESQRLVAVARRAT